MSRNSAFLSVLRTPVAASPAALVGTGAASLDARLGGGLTRGALHEVFADDSEAWCAAAGFALMLAWRGCSDKPLVWVREDSGERGHGRLYAPGIVALGADPAAMILVTGPDALAVLRAGADIVGCDAVGAVVIEPWGKAPVLDLTASRRLALAAARSGVLTLVLRAGAAPAPSAATTRWRVAAAPSVALAANAPGRPAFDISLLRHRGGIAGFDARVEWDRDLQCFCDTEGLGTSLSGRVPAVVAGRAAADFGRRAA